jgi:ABC-type transport system involved in cytochrome c biogenesis permease subunit
MYEAISRIVDHKLIFTLALIGLTAAISWYAISSRRQLLWWLRVQSIIVAAAIVYLGALVLTPILFSQAPVASAEAHILLPAYDYSPWHALPVQVDGRTKPFDTAARELVREVCGREKFEGQDPVALVLQWMLAPRGGRGDAYTDWDKKAFILCDHLDLRKAVFAHFPEAEQTDEQRHGKYVSPAELRESPGLKKLLAGARSKRAEDREKAQHNMEPAEREAERVERRLGEYLAVSQVDASAFAEVGRMPDPFHFVILDRVPSGAWFSLAELRDLLRDESGGRWQSLIYDRLAQTPQLYIDMNPQLVQALEHFQAQLKSGDGLKAIDELDALLAERRDQKVRDIEASEGAKIKDLSDEQLDRLLARAGIQPPPDRTQRVELVLRAMREHFRKEFEQDDNKLTTDLKARVQRAMQTGYKPDNPEFRMLHFDYLEARYSNIYRDSLAVQKFPREDADRIKTSSVRLSEAYLSADAAQFANASLAFMTAVREVSEKYAKYPGEDTIGNRLVGLFRGRAISNADSELLALEQRFNEGRPFMWAWILMLVSAIGFISSMSLNSRVAYGLGLAGYLASLGYQGFGFFSRIAISGRPPVSNIYETVIWVAFMSAVFALILELIYRRRVIALAGALVATLGLVLADQLPLALDPKISPIVPVLRSNYWLTIHVLTIVSSYAGGTLAWGLGNIALALLAFGSPRRDVVKTLSQYTYRAMQIAVLLLAAGTFLGGWWAAESWGRFWGWDPKEVWALIALVCYVIPLHMRFIGWVKDFGLAVAAVLCFAAIVMSWYGVNFVLGAGLHSYGFADGGPWWVFLAGLINIEWVLLACWLYAKRQPIVAPAPQVETMLVSAEPHLGAEPA